MKNETIGTVLFVSFQKKCETIGTVPIVSKNDAGKYLKNMYYRLDKENRDFRDFNLSKTLAEKSIKESKSQILSNTNFVGNEVGIRVSE